MKTVVYVRKPEGGSKDQRTMSFVPPDGLSQDEILDRGWAIDGTHVLFSVTRQDLATRQEELRTLLARFGRKVQFA